jgi:hypothetical protein
MTTDETNPYTYLEGAVVDAARVGDGINLRIQPRGTYGLFTENVLLCDMNNVGRRFAGKGGLVVLTYETQARRMIEGVGCHELRSVDQIQEERP